MTPSKALWIVVLASAFLVPDPGLAAQDKGLTPADVARIQYVLGVHPDRDGFEVAFTRLVQRPLEAGPGSAFVHLFAKKAGEPERLLLGGMNRVGGVCWSPDFKEIHFLKKGGGDRHVEVYALPMDGGEPRRVTRTSRGVQSFKWSPDGAALAYTAADQLPRLRSTARKMGFRPKVVDEEWTGVSLYVRDRKTGKSRRLTRRRTVFSFEWASDGKKLAVGLAPRNLIDDRYMFTRLWLVRPSPGRGGKIMEPLVENPGKLGGYAWSPDSTRLAYIAGADRRDPHAGMLYVVDTADRKPRCLTEGFKGMVHEVKWKDDDTLLAVVTTGVYSHLYEIRLADGRASTVLSGGDVAFRHFARSGNGKAIFLTGSTATHPGEVFRVKEGGGLERLTRSNPWMKDVALGRQRVFSFKARDGLAIEGLLMDPVGYKEGTQYPLVILVHGGPEAHFSNGWHTDYGRWGQLLAARGYFVWYPNYRASTGYGVAFAKANHGDPMGREFEDHLDAIDALDAEGLIDPKRVGLGGGSYGGYAAAWAATRHSKHFAAAIAFVPFVDVRTKWYTSDIPNEFYLVHYEEKWPHEQVAFLAERSPLTHAPACRTPLLICGGTADTRVHPSQPFMLYRAVKFATSTPVRYVQYPGEGHGNRLNVYRFDYCIRSLRWFDHYLKQGDHRLDEPPPLDLNYRKWMKKGR